MDTLTLHIADEELNQLLQGLEEQYSQIDVGEPDNLIYRDADFPDSSFSPSGYKRTLILPHYARIRSDLALINETRPEWKQIEANLRTPIIADRLARLSNPHICGLTYNGDLVIYGEDTKHDSLMTYNDTVMDVTQRGFDLAAVDELPLLPSFFEIEDGNYWAKPGMNRCQPGRHNGCSGATRVNFCENANGSRYVGLAFNRDPDAKMIVKPLLVLRVQIPMNTLSVEKITGVDIGKTDPPTPPVQMDTTARAVSAIVNTPAELNQAEVPNEDPIVANLRAGHEELQRLASRDEYYKKLLLCDLAPSWETIAAKLTPKILRSIKGFKKPKIYGFNEHGELIIGDYSQNQIPRETYDLNYFEARTYARDRGLGLMTKNECEQFLISQTCSRKGRYSHTADCTWIDSGESPTDALYIFWNEIVRITFHSTDAKEGDPLRGAHLICRIKIA